MSIEELIASESPKWADVPDADAWVASVRGEAAPQGVMYSVIRYMPSVLRGEFVNVGVMVVRLGQHWHGLKVVQAYGATSRVMLLPGSDGEFVRHALEVLAARLAGAEAEAWTEGRFSDLRAAYTANNIRLTPLRPAVTEDPAALLDTLFTEMVE